MSGALTGKRILVVEDEYYIASDITAALRSQDALVIGPVAKLDAGFRLSEAEPLDAAVLDINLEGAMSYPLADKLCLEDVPMLFVTGYDGWAVPDSYRDVPRIGKPFSTDKVLDAVAALIIEKPSS